MKYIVIELKDKPCIISKNNESDGEREPIIFEMRQDAERVANKCKHGLVYPLVDVMHIFRKLKSIANKYEAETADDFDLINGILNELNEVV